MARILNNTRNFMVGDIVLAVLRKVSSKKGMITEILKDNKVRVLDCETKDEEVIDAGDCFGVDITEDLLSNVLGFQKHEVKRRYNAIKEETTEEWIKAIYDSENPEINFLLTIPSKRGANDPWILEVSKPGDSTKSSVEVKSLHELQNQVYFQTRLVLC
jgi:hypothetical protein